MRSNLSIPFLSTMRVQWSRSLSIVFFVQARWNLRSKPSTWQMKKGAAICTQKIGTTLCGHCRHIAKNTRFYATIWKTRRCSSIFCAVSWPVAWENEEKAGKPCNKRNRFVWTSLAWEAPMWGKTIYKSTLLLLIKSPARPRGSSWLYRQRSVDHVTHVKLPKQNYAAAFLQDFMILAAFLASASV